MRTSRFRCIRATAPDAETAERVLAEALSAGASGAEERAAAGRVTLLLYAPDERAAGVRRAACAVLGSAAVSEPAPVEEADWSEAWKAFQGPIDVSPRLRIRPSFARGPSGPGQAELVIDPGQAFGTGAHESTRLALDGLDALHGALGARTRVLDVGTGSGVLALAALRLGAGRAVGLDLDPRAAEVARGNARANGLARRFEVFAGPVEALHPAARFDLVLANLLRRELMPVVPALVERLQPSGWIVISGLLETEADDCAACAARQGLRPERWLRRRDASGVGWAGLVMRPRPERPGAGG